MKFAILFLIFVSLISCEQKPSSRNVNEDSIAKIIGKDSIAETDSAKLLHKMIKSITDTLPEFLNAKLSPGTDADSSNNFCGLNVYKGDSITSFYLNDTVNGVEVSYYPNGNLMRVSRTYRKGDFFRIKNYDSNGKLISQGLVMPADWGLVAMNCPGVPIGKWTFYSNKKDSVVDHDLDYKISYPEAIRIAEKHGWSSSEISIQFHSGVKMNGDKVVKVNGEEMRTDFWEIVYKGKNKNENPTSVLQINMRTGQEKFVKTPTLILCT